jgi:ATP-dependent helicase/nuclease subunit A
MKTVDKEITLKLKSGLNMFIESAKTHNWFDSGYTIMNESEFLLPDGTVLRPDRLLLKDKKAVVIDYKTGIEETHHDLQVQQYATVLKNMGYDELSMFLVYPGLGKVKEVYL